MGFSTLSNFLPCAHHLLIPHTHNMKLLVILVIGFVTLSSGQRFRGRQGRQGQGYLAPAPSDDVDTSYLAPAPSDEEAVAPADNYGAASEVEEYVDDYDPSDVPEDQAAPLDNYGVDQPAYEGEAADAAGEDMGLKMLMTSVPGVPGEDYPILADVPETAFSCEGQVPGGYYADSEAECQVFHICADDAQGGLAKYSFLCPNGTIFNQNYFICDWWFNFDCAEAEGLYSLNEEIAAEREAATGAASSPAGSYASPDSAPIGGYDAPADVVEDAQAAYGQAARNARNGRGPQQGFGAPQRRGRNGRRNGRRN